jgi:hypothetical protein
MFPRGGKPPISLSQGDRMTQLFSATSKLQEELCTAGPGWGSQIHESE